MARASTRKAFFNYVGGKQSDSSALLPVEGKARILLNVDLEADGRISRRLGVDFEEGFATSSVSFTKEDLENVYVSLDEWRNVANDGRTHYFIVRVGNSLIIYDESAQPVSTGEKIVLDISQFARSPLSKGTDLDMVSGKGFLFCSGEDYDPFYVQFQVDESPQISAVGIDITVRDTWGIDEGVPVDQRPTTLTDSHNYNLINQGWDETRIPDVFGAAFPSNADIEFLGFKADSDGNRVFSTDHLISQKTGSTRAPRGHVIIDPFTENRQDATGLTGLPALGTNLRPHAVGFYASRVWYGGPKGRIYFSQILEDISLAGNCHQQNDPTTEDFNSLLDTDGGVINSPEIGIVYAFAEYSNGLLILANNGTWYVSGGTENFTANHANLTKLSDVGAINRKSVVAAENGVFFWSEEGIYSITSDSTSGLPRVTSISSGRIDKDYFRIPAIAKTLTEGTYDRIQKKIYWSYHDSQTNLGTAVGAKYNSVLVYSLLLDAFWDYRIEDFDDTFTAPFVAGLAKINVRTEGSKTEFVEADGENLTADGELITVQVNFEGVSDTAVKILTFDYDTPSGKFEVTFSEFCSRSFHDWFTFDGATEGSGVNYQSVIETLPETLGDVQADKQATWITTFYDFIRNGYGVTGATPRPDPSRGFRVSQKVVEILRSGNPTGRTSQTVIEVIRDL